MILQAEGVVLKTFDFRETSRIVVFFTREHGKVKGVLKGIRKDPKKFGSHVDKFSVNDLVYYTHRNSDIHLISQCDLKSFFLPLRQDMKKNMAAHYGVELVDAMMPTEEKNEAIYQLLLHYLKSLGQAKDISTLVHIFQVKMLVLSGFQPHIDACVVCQKKISPKMKFSIKLGGLLCEDCFENDIEALTISRGAVASLLHIEQNDWEKTLRLTLSMHIKKELKFILNSFLVFHLERQLKTTRFL